MLVNGNWPALAMAGSRGSGGRGIHFAHGYVVLLIPATLLSRLA